ncbi:hypothetical protein A0H81_09234 [Grifola frondosa]|uniref:Uncharacterized protein n=1 Tax=Grifola frondosa TaxID=5627 RepID=A0A1C7M2H2_GRIFR|nr:hypothetical protein A0H81_09234 [Grifola frondosa]
MRLLNTTTITIQDFPVPQTIPPYAILSHRWRSEEVSFHDLANPTVAKTRHGYAKVSRCCIQARQDGYTWVWIDSCCIDQTSSAELSEAINSMNTWYNKSGVCYAYLDDVQGEEHSSLRSSEWFCRGWTLQELIAPACVVFFTRDWVRIGTRTTLAGVIEDITRVDHGVLVSTRSPAEISVAKRMSWASGRSTTREEDRSYSLMGLFGVNMPVLYGEGSRAFIRLQHEIIKLSNDPTIFAWSGSDHTETSPLASSPDDFRQSSDIIRIPHESFARHFPGADLVPEHSVTNYGVRIRLPLVSRPSGTFLAVLACVRWPRGQTSSHTCKAIGLELRKNTGSHYIRAGHKLLDIEDLDHFSSDAVVREIYIGREDPALVDALLIGHTAPPCVPTTDHSTVVYIPAPTKALYDDDVAYGHSQGLSEVAGHAGHESSSDHDGSREHERRGARQEPAISLPVVDATFLSFKPTLLDCEALLQQLGSILYAHLRRVDSPLRMFTTLSRTGYREALSLKLAFLSGRENHAHVGSTAFRHSGSRSTDSHCHASNSLLLSDHLLCSTNQSWHLSSLIPCEKRYLRSCHWAARDQSRHPAHLRASGYCANHSRMHISTLLCLCNCGASSCLRNFCARS